MQRLQVRYASECKVPNERGEVKVWRGFISRYLLESKAKPSPKQSVKFKCKIWSKITKQVAKKCLDASSL